MDKIFMKILMAQGAIDVIFNAYQRHHAFVLSNSDIVEYCDYFEKCLVSIKELVLGLPDVSVKK